MEALVIGQSHDPATPMSRASFDPASTPCLEIS
jgi:hypothetical protein